MKSIDSPIRVLIIVSSFAVEGPQGGVERFAIEMASRFDKSRFELTMCGLWRHGFAYEEKWMDYLSRQGVNVFTTAPWSGSTNSDALTSLRFLARHLAHQPKFDIIHSHAAFPDIAAIWVRLLGKARYLVRTVHSEREWYRRPVRGVIFNQIITPLMYPVEVGVSKKIVADLNGRLLARLLKRQARLYYSPHNPQRMMNVQVDVTAKKRSLDLPCDAPVVGSVGRFTTQKGYIYFLEMIPQILLNFPDCQFLLVGTGELLPVMKQKAVELGITGHIHFLGARTDVEELLPIMDIFVSSSLWEGFPAVIQEAMASGTTVIATAVSGSSELIQNEQTGLLVPPADSPALGEAVCKLLKSPELSKTLAGNAQQAVGKIDTNQVKLEYEALFEEIYWS